MTVLGKFLPIFENFDLQQIHVNQTTCFVNRVFSTIFAQNDVITRLVFVTSFFTKTVKSFEENSLSLPRAVRPS